MKLRNKKTGDIKEVIVGGYPVSGKTKMWEVSEMDANEEIGYKTLGTYTSLAELNEEWEDYEEPKEYWCITGRGNLHYLQDMTDENDMEHKVIGNYFETKEEAEKAVEKLKAWKRLKDKGFKFECWYGGSRIIRFRIDSLDKEDDRLPHLIDGDTANDLELLFGGEE